VFVLLEHSTASGVHWDLLIEQPAHDSLLTWRLLANPLANDSVPAQSIGRHRRVYLDFEGEIAGGRGSVRRIDRGAAILHEDSAGAATVELSGGQLRGTFEFTPSAVGTRFRRITR
jgi:hypothetical protein